MKRITLFLLLLTTLALPAQRSERFSVGVMESLVTPGPLSKNEGRFWGREGELSVGYAFLPAKKKVGAEIRTGLTLAHYRYRLSDALLVIHRQWLLPFQLTGYIQPDERLRLHAGVRVIVPLLYEALDTRPQSGAKVYFHDINTGSYHLSGLQAGATIGIEYLAGEKKNTGLGFFLTQMGTSPVRENENLIYTYPRFDPQVANNAGKFLEPLHYSFRVCVRLVKKKKAAEE